jgi:hypothetical protein
MRRNVFDPLEPTKEAAGAASQCQGYGSPTAPLSYKRPDIEEDPGNDTDKIIRPTIGAPKIQMGMRLFINFSPVILTLEVQFGSLMRPSWTKSL